MAACNLGMKTSMIWEFFIFSEDSKLAIRNACEAKVPRGGTTTKLFTTTNLIHHLMTKYLEVHTKYLERKAKSQNNRRRQEKDHYSASFLNRSIRPNKDLGHIQSQISANSLQNR